MKTIFTQEEVETIKSETFNKGFDRGLLIGVIATALTSVILIYIGSN